MIAEAKTWVDVEAAVRAWAKENIDDVGRRVFFGENDKKQYPQIVLRRISGPDDACLIQFDVWGDTKVAAMLVATKLATALDALSRYVSGGVILHGATVESERWLPDFESDKPRYILDVIFTATANS